MMTARQFLTHRRAISTLFIIMIMCVCGMITYVAIYLSTWRQPWRDMTHKDLLSMSRNKFVREELYKTNSQVYQNVKGCEVSDSRSLFNCSVINFLATVDPTARGYDSDLVCDELSKTYDIICRLYLRQIGLESQDFKICSLESPDKVPRIVYYVIFGIYTFKFLHYISITAAKRFISPTAIYVIGDQHPTGYWWQRVLKDVHGVRFLYRELPGNISGLRPPGSLHHLSDIVRLQALYMNGGIYLDADMVVLKNLEPLLDYDITLGLLDNKTGMGNAFIVTKRGSTFIQEWYTEYLKYKPGEFRWNSLKVPRLMWIKNSSRVHMLSDQLYRPNWYETELLFNRSDYPWRNNYAIHVWTRNQQIPESPSEIATANTTVAQIFRYVLYGDHRIRNGH